MNKNTWLGRRIYCWKLTKKWNEDKINSLYKENQELREKLSNAKSWDGVDKVIISEAAFKTNYNLEKPIDPNKVPMFIKEPEPTTIKTIRMNLPPARRAGKTKGKK